MPTLTKSFTTVVSFSGLVDRLDEEADDVENRAPKRENARRDAMVLCETVVQCVSDHVDRDPDGHHTTRDALRVQLVIMFISISIALVRRADDRVGALLRRS